MDGRLPDGRFPVDGRLPPEGRLPDGRLPVDGRFPVDGLLPVDGRLPEGRLPVDGRLLLRLPEERLGRLIDGERLADGRERPPPRLAAPPPRPPPPRPPPPRPRNARASSLIQMPVNAMHSRQVPTFLTRDIFSVLQMVLFQSVVWEWNPSCSRAGQRRHYSRSTITSSTLGSSRPSMMRSTFRQP